KLRCPSSTHYPYTTLFRSSDEAHAGPPRRIEAHGYLSRYPSRQDRGSVHPGNRGPAYRPGIGRHRHQGEEEDRPGSDAREDESRDRKSTRLNSSHVKI